MASNGTNISTDHEENSDSQEGIGVQSIFNLSPEAELLFDELSDNSKIYLNNALSNLSQEEINQITPGEWISFIKTAASFGEFAPMITHVIQQNHDLRENIKKSHTQFKLLLIVIIFSIAVIAILGSLFAVYPKYRVVQTIDNSKICEVPVKDNPLLSDSAVSDFAKKAVLAVYSFDYTNSAQQVNDATSRYFTPEGKNDFIQALKNSGSYDYVVNNNLIMRTTSLSDAQIDEKGVGQLTGKKYWVVRMPIRVNFYTGGRDPADTKTYMVELRLTETVRDAFHTNGIGVYSLTYSPYKFSNK